MKGNDWNLEITAPPELHKPIQELFDAITWAIKRSYAGNNKEIILCRDCKYRNASHVCERFNRIAENYNLWYIVEDDDFCSDAERI